MRKTFQEFLVACTFMTRIPIPAVPYKPGVLGCAAKFFPLVGLAIGLVAAAIHRLLSSHLQPQVLAVVLLTYLVLITGALHEDGLADAADAFGAGWSKTQILSIMRDSRIGSYGAVAVTLSLLARFALISNIASARLPEILIAASVLCRWTSLPLGFLLPYARKGEGLGDEVAGHLELSTVAWATLFAAISVGAVLGRGSLSLWLITISLTAISGLYFKHRIGGVTGDCFGAANQITEVAIYFYEVLRS